MLAKEPWSDQVLTINPGRKTPPSSNLSDGTVHLVIAKAKGKGNNKMGNKTNGNSLCHCFCFCLSQ